MGIILWLLTIGAQALAVVGLTRWLGIPWGLGAYALVCVATTGLAGYLLQQSKAGEISWRNRVAGWLLPWLLLAGSGTLSALLAKNLVFSLAWGGLLVAGVQGNWLLLQSPELTEGAKLSWSGIFATAINWLTLFCRFALLIGWLLLLRPWIAGRSLRGLPRTTWRPLVIAPLAIIGSVILSRAGYPFLGLLAVGVPLFAVLSPLLLMIGVLAYLKVTGKRIRWN